MAKSLSLRRSRAIWHSNETTMAETTNPASSPYTLLNNRCNNGAKHSNESILQLFGPWITGVKRCKAKLGKNADGSPIFCNCTNFIDDNQVACSAPAKYLLQWGAKGPQNRRQVIVTQVRCHKVATKNVSNIAYKFAFPFIPDGLSDEDIANINSLPPLCKVPYCDLHSIKSAKWSAIVQDTTKSPIASAHKHKGKEPNSKLKSSNPIVATAHSFFATLSELGEPVATRVVREETGETAMRDHDVRGEVHLPCSFSRRGLYQRNCNQQGWNVLSKNNGSVIKKWVGAGPPQKNIMSRVCVDQVLENQLHPCQGCQVLAGYLQLVPHLQPA